MRRPLVAALVATSLISLHWLWAAYVAPPDRREDGVAFLALLPSAATLLATVGLVAWATRTGWLLVQARRAVARLEPVPWPAKLAIAVRRTGVEAVRCVRDPGQAAFCAGIVRPGVYVTSGLVAALGVDELCAVLLHEGAHARRRDPLRRAGGRAAVEVVWHIPLVDWWFRQALERAELAADRAALGRLGPAPLARALVAMDIPVAPAVGAAAFDGAAPARVAQLLGDPVPRQRPSLAAWTLTIGLTMLSLNLAMCLIETVASLAL